MHKLFFVYQIFLCFLFITFLWRFLNFLRIFWNLQGRWIFHQRSFLLLESGGLSCCWRWLSLSSDSWAGGAPGIALWRQSTTRLIWFCCHLRCQGSRSSGDTPLILAAVLMCWKHLSWSYRRSTYCLLSCWWFVLSLLVNLGGVEWFSWLFTRLALTWCYLMLFDWNGWFTSISFNFLWWLSCSFTSIIKQIRIRYML